MVRESLALGIVFLFISSTVTPAVISYDEPDERDEFLDNLANICYDERGVFNEEKYNQLRQYESLHNVETEEKTIPQETQQTCSTSNGLMDSAWPMKCHDLHHTGLSPYSTADNPLTEKWRFKSDKWTDNDPSIDNDGIIYFGGGADAFPWYLFAVYPNGTEKWRYNTGGLLLGNAPAIAEDGAIYMPSWSHHLHALNPNGTLKWKYDAHADIGSSPAIADDGTIIFGTLSPGNEVIALYPSGLKKWSYDIGSRVYSDPAIGDDGTIYIGSDNGYLYAFDENGSLKWRYPTDGEIKGPPSIADDGTIYFGSYDDYIYALYPNGLLRWKTETPYGSGTNPSLGADGMIFITSGYDLLAIYPNNGTIKWSFGLTGHVDSSSPVISEDGTIFVGTQIGSPGEGGEIVAVYLDGTERWRKRLSNKWVESSPCIGSDGTVYICSSSMMDVDSFGYLHAFGPVESNEPPTTPTIDGPLEGQVSEVYTYYVSSTDPDNNPVGYFVDWDDGTNEWTMDYEQGLEIPIEHEWEEEDTYTIAVKARDSVGAESDWAYLEVTMPVSQHSYSFPLLQQLFNRFPNAFPILRNILGY